MSPCTDVHSEIAYIYSNESAKIFDKLPSNKGRSSMVHSLIKELGLLNYSRVFEPIMCSRKFLEQYHSNDYLDKIFSPNNVDLEELESFGLVDDCSVFEGLLSYAKYLGGSVESILKALDEGYRYVINWDGGRHHAQASLASGFCFINDVVLLILNLEEHYDKIIYVDLDLHHGDGVENAFLYSDNVFTFSMHKHAAGFFPGTGSFEDHGKGRGTGYCLNLPITHNISGDGFYETFSYAFSRLLQKFDPDIIICVCGADILSTDPHAAFNVGTDNYSRCVSEIVSTKIPAIFLGGGGYDHPSTAKLWSILTHKIISESCTAPELPDVVPEHEFWPLYLHDENLRVLENNDVEADEKVYIEELKSLVDERIL